MVRFVIRSLVEFPSSVISSLQIYITDTLPSQGAVNHSSEYATWHGFLVKHLLRATKICNELVGVGINLWYHHHTHASSLSYDTPCNAL